MALLHTAHYGLALDFARELMSNTQEADDVVHEAFVKVVSAIHNGHGPTDLFPAYLYTAIRSVANTFWKKVRP